MTARPAIVTAGLVLMVMVGSVPARADAPNGSADSGGNGGPLHDAVEDFGQSLCPKLVKPGSDLATAVSEMQGNSGLAPTMTGMIAGLAIQLECPAFMSSVADGRLPQALQQAGKGPTAPLLQLPGLGTSLAPAQAAPNVKSVTGH